MGGGGFVWQVRLFVVETFLQVVLPEEEGSDRKHTKDYEYNNV
jgi:hypothetical protein